MNPQAPSNPWRLLIALFLVAFLLAIPSRAAAIILELNAGPRVVGFLVREDDTTIVVRRQVDGRDVEQSYPKSEIALILRAVDPERLASLRPNDPKAYRNYAEELAEKRDDPEARELALHLFHIAAALDPAGLGRGCLLGMSTLADTPEQERRYRALAYLLDPRHDRSVLQPSTASPATGGAGSTRGRRQFAQALAAYRTQQTTRALKLAAEPGARDLFAQSPGLPTYDAFLKACRDHPECASCDIDGRVKCPACKGSGLLVSEANPEGRGLGRFNIPGGNRCPDCDGWGTVPCPDCNGRKAGVTLDDEQLAAFLRAELAAEAPPADPAAGNGTTGWSAALRRGSPPAPMLSLRNLTPFDPARSIYRDGRWLPPDAPR